MSKSQPELEDLWARAEIAKATYYEAVRLAKAEAVEACAPLHGEVRRAYKAYHDRSKYLRGVE
jgi:hypothetical protein